MNFLDDPRREPLINQILSARTLPEVEAAQVALRAWHQRYPDDWGILDGGEQLSHFHDALLEGYVPFSKPVSWTEWQWVECQAMGARTLPDIHDSRHALTEWTERHSDETMPETLETLFLLLDVVEEQIGRDGQESNGTRDVKTQRELAGQAV